MEAELTPKAALCALADTTAGGNQDQNRGLSLACSPPGRLLGRFAVTYVATMPSPCPARPVAGLRGCGPKPITVTNIRSSATKFYGDIERSMVDTMARSWLQ